MCEHNDEVIGVLNLRFEQQLHHSECIAEIMEFSINPLYRNKGIGKEMFEEACKIAKNRNCIQIEVACNNLEKIHIVFT
ncbi:MAG: GNAT family N-acetyltransferase [Intestinibacter bartlettii]